jgi:hypothetical protein
MAGTRAAPLPLAALLVPLLARGAAANLLPFTLRYTADPAPFVAPGSGGDGASRLYGDGAPRLYISTSHDLANQTQYEMKDYSLISSVDLANWMDHGIVFDSSKVKWGPRTNGSLTPGAWAQQVIGPLPGEGCTDANGCWWMYWPNAYIHSNASGGGTGVALSTTGPAGPYTDVTPNGIPLMPGDDPTVYRDGDNGRVYLCGNPTGAYGPPGTGAPVCGVLAADMVSWDTAAVPAPPHYVNLTGIPHFFEAPWLQKRGSGKNAPWLLSYMCPGRNEVPSYTIAHYGKDICQAVCYPNASNACPLGDYTFLAGAPLQWSPPYDCDTPFGCSTGEVGSNAHHGLAEFPPGSGRWVAAYHTRLLGASRGVPNPGLQRSIAVDAAYPDPATGGVSFQPVTATPEWLRPLAYVDPYAPAGVPGALTAGASPGMDTEALAPADPGSPGGGRAIVFPPGAAGWLRVAGVDFGVPSAGGVPRNLTVRVAAVGGGTGPGTAVGVVLTLDAPTGLPVALCPVPPAAAGWATVTCPLSQGGPTGVHDVFLSVSAVQPGAPGVRLAWWRADGGAASGAVPPPVEVPCTALRSKANGQPLLVPPTPATPVTAGPASGGGGSPAVHLVDNEDGSWAVRAPPPLDGRFLCAGPAAGSSVTPSATAPGQPCARFRVVGTTDGSYALYALGVAPSPLALAVDPATGAVTASAADPRNATADGARFWLDCGRPLTAAAAASGA